MRPTIWLLLPLPLLACMPLEIEERLLEVRVLSCRAAGRDAILRFALNGETGAPPAGLPRGVVLRVVVTRERRIVRRYFQPEAVVHAWETLRTSEPVDLFYVTDQRSCDWFARHPQGIVFAPGNGRCDPMSEPEGICALDSDRVIADVPPPLAPYAR